MPANNTRKNPFLLAPALTFVVLAFLAVLTFARVGAHGGISRYFLMAGLMLLMFGIPSAAFVMLRGGRAVSAVIIRPSTGNQIGVSAAVALVLILQSCLLKFGLFHVNYSGDVYTLYSAAFLASPSSFGEFLLMLVVLVMLPAVCEEWFFRGVLVYEYRLGGFLGAALMSSLFFAMSTLDFAQLPVAFLNGMLLSLAVFLTGNLLSAIFAHAIYNFFALFLERYMWGISKEPDCEVLFWVLTVALYLLSLIALFAAAEKALRRMASGESAPPLQIPSGKRPIVIYDMLTAPALWADALVFAITALIGIFI